MKSEIKNRLHSIGIIPVVKIDNAEQALPLTEALLKGGISCVEITFRTGAAAESIRKIHAAFPEVLLGAGTILNIDQASAAIDAGAEFLVSPGFNPKVVKFAIDNEISMLPGCITPTEIEHAMEYGIEVIKFFPAEQAGGLSMIKALSAPYGKIMFVPTGGISLSNLHQYISFNKVLACGGSFMIIDDMNEVTWRSAEACKAVKSARE